MFSEHIKKEEHAAGQNLLVIAGFLVVVCQLVALALVANEQVEKAQIRDAKLGTARAVMAQCLESSAGFERHQCILQYRDESEASIFAQSNRAPQNFLQQTGDMQEERGEAWTIRGLSTITPMTIVSRQ